MKPVSAQTMAQIDRKAQEDYGISQGVLMENAGQSVSEEILSEIISGKDERIAVFCGKGNNGGDGFVAARYLVNKDCKELTVYVTDINGITPGAALDNFKTIQKMGLAIRPLNFFLKEKETDFTIYIDSIFGTGFRGELPEECAAVARGVNSSGGKRYGVDVPSGLDATTGHVAKDCFKAHKTITFGLPKQGFYKGDGPLVCGTVVVKDIGFPPALLEPYI